MLAESDEFHMKNIEISRYQDRDNECSKEKGKTKRGKKRLDKEIPDFTDEQNDTTIRFRFGEQPYFFLFSFFFFFSFSSVRRRKNLRERDRPVRFVATRRLGKVNGNVIFIRLVPRSILLATVLTPRKT